MKQPSAIVLVVDRLGAGFLGPYGNTWLETPQWNRLATQSLLCETVISDSPDLEAVYRSYWTGRHAWQKTAADGGDIESRPALATKCNAAGRTTLLITDDHGVANHPLAAGFHSVVILPAEEGKLAEDIEETALFRSMTGALAAIDEAMTSDDGKGPAVVWIHLRGLGGPWDGPLELRQQFADEEDPAPPEIVEPPEQVLPKGFDPDELLGLVHAYAGQVSLLDMCLGLFLDAVDHLPRASETLLAVTSPRGYPLGEHRRVGPCDKALFAELLQVPLLVRFPAREGALERTQRLVQPADVHATLVDWLGLEAGKEIVGNSLWKLVQGEPQAAREAAIAVSQTERAVRTPAWFLRESVLRESLLRESQQAGDKRRELFAKPDDRWEANEIASRAEEIVEALSVALDRFQEIAGNSAEIPTLDEALLDARR